MSSEFDNLFAEKALPVFAKKMGERGYSYTAPTGGEPIPLVHAMVGNEVEEEYETDDGIRTRKVRQMTLITRKGHPKFCGVEDPLIAATVTIELFDSCVTYSVLDVNRDYATADLKLKNTMHIERTRQGFRRSNR